MFEACGNSAFLTGSFSAIAREFPTRVASMFSLIELFFGIGKSYLSNRIPRIIKCKNYKINTSFVSTEGTKALHYKYTE